MPLSEDSRALLQLLLGRGKSYADISGLLGIDEAEVRRRAGAALAEVDDSVPAPDQELTDYLLGQADEISRADVGNRISSDPATAEQAESLTDQLRLLVPGATLPKPGSAEGGKPKPAPKAAPAVSSTSGSGDDPTKKGSGGFGSITGHQRRLIAVLLGGALLAAVVILLVTGVIGGGSDDEPETPKSSPTVAVLQPVDGSAASGQVQFGFSGTSLAANLQISDLKPNERGQGYAIWLYGSTGAFPIHAQQVGKSGAISGQIQVNEAVICLIASDFFPTLRVSRVDNSDFSKALKDANLGGNQKKLKLPDYTGKTVLEGEISMPQDAKDTIVPVCNGTANQSQAQ